MFESFLASQDVLVTQYFFVTQVSYILISILFIVSVLICLENGKQKCDEVEEALAEPPSPWSLPVIGHLHLLSGYEVPFQAFTDLGKKYGDIIKLKLGNTQSIVVNGQRNIREVLVTKGHHFDSRPNFERLEVLFCGNKDNSLAFCDWSDVQKTRRDMLKTYMFPRAFTSKFNALETIISQQTTTLLSTVQENMKIKTQILKTCANIFMSHFCSRSFSNDDQKFATMVDNFDDIFFEVNSGYAADFLPFLLPLHSKHLSYTRSLTHNIRKFISEEVVSERVDSFSENDEPEDYVESLIKYVKFTDCPEINWNTAMFALEDIIGGHAAVGNLLVKILAFLVKEPKVQKKVQEEIDDATAFGDKFRSVNISDRNTMPYTESVVFEGLRIVASPIVPRVANQDSSVNGYRIKKGSLIFFNNYDMNMSTELWDEPDKFKPERFLVNGRFLKPDHFLPFGGGRRSCIGYKMVLLVSFGILSALLQNYTIHPIDGHAYKVPIGSLALAKPGFEFRFVKRSVTIE